MSEEPVGLETLGTCGLGFLKAEGFSCVLVFILRKLACFVGDFWVFGLFGDLHVGFLVLDFEVWKGGLV